MVSRSLILFEEYKKAVPDLIISDQERQKLEIENKNKIITELEKRRKSSNGRENKKIRGYQ